jgi:hypothetical protein
LFECIRIVGYQGVCPHQICNRLDPCLQCFGIFPSVTIMVRQLPPII